MKHLSQTIIAIALLCNPPVCTAETAELSANNLRRAAAYSAGSNGVSMVVMQNGRLIFEDYPNGHSAAEAHELASGTKSFAGVAAIAAAEDGLLSLDEKLSKTITEWQSDPQRKDITIRQLLTLTSGVQGTVLKPPPYAESISVPLTAAVGTRFQYGAAPFQIFGELMRRKCGATMVEYLQRRVLTPAGISVGKWRTGSDGMPYIPQGAWLTGRQWAKYGELIRNGGMANGKQILKREDLKVLFEGTAANPMYGLTWWLNRPIDERLRDSIRQLSMGTDLRYGAAGVPDDLVMAAGLGKQRLYIIPSRQMVIVRQADKLGRAMLRRDKTGFSDQEFMQILFDRK